VKQLFAGVSMYTMLQHDLEWCHDPAIEAWFRNSPVRNARMGLLSALGYRAQEVQMTPGRLRETVVKYTDIYVRDFRHECCFDNRTLGAIDCQFAQSGYCDAKTGDGELTYLGGLFQKTRQEEDLELLAKLFRDLLPLGLAHPRPVLKLIGSNVDFENSCIATGRPGGPGGVPFSALLGWGPTEIGRFRQSLRVRRDTRARAAAESAAVAAVEVGVLHDLFTTLGTLALVHPQAVVEFLEARKVEQKYIFLIRSYEDRHRLVEFREKRQMQRAGNFLAYRIDGLRSLITRTVEHAVGLAESNLARSPEDQALIKPRDLQQIILFLLAGGLDLLEPA
jgi:hypothetical protein